MSNPRNPVKKALMNSNNTFKETGIKKLRSKKQVKNISKAKLNNNYLQLKDSHLYLSSKTNCFFQPIDGRDKNLHCIWHIKWWEL